jgi:hypothetical protein
MIEKRHRWYQLPNMTITSRLPIVPWFTTCLRSDTAQGHKPRLSASFAWSHHYSERPKRDSYHVVPKDGEQATFHPTLDEPEPGSHSTLLDSEVTEGKRNGPNGPLLNGSMTAATKGIPCLTKAIHTGCTRRAEVRVARWGYREAALGDRCSPSGTPRCAGLPRAEALAAPGGAQLVGRSRFRVEDSGWPRDREAYPPIRRRRSVSRSGDLSRSGRSPRTCSSSITMVAHRREPFLRTAEDGSFVAERT